MEIWQQIPDGRPAADHHLGYPPADSTGERRVEELEPFIQGCLSLLPEMPAATGPRTGLFLFVLGAADHFWDRLHLDDRRFAAYAESLLRRFGLGWEQAATLVAALPQLTRQSPARAALLEGAQTLDLWLDSRDANLMLRVKELMAQWRRMPTE